MRGAKVKELRKLSEKARLSGYKINFRHVKKMYSKYKEGAIDTLNGLINNPVQKK